MSFDTIEKGAVSRKVNFLQILRGNLYYRYTDADRDVVMNGVPWSAIPFSVGNATYSGNASTDTLEVTAPNTLEAVQTFRGQAPSDQVFMTLFQAHATQIMPLLVFDADIAAVWVGTISDVGQKNTDRIVIKGSTLASAFDREGVRLSYGRNCNRVLYDRWCGVNPATYRQTFNVEAVSGDKITSAVLGAHGDGYYDEGYIEWQIADGVWQRLAIARQFQGTITLLGTADGVNVGRQMNAYPGCAQTKDMCQNKFNNILNYGGFDMPGVSPFTGNPVF